MTPVLDRFQSLHAVDYAAIAAYFAVVIWVGFYYGRRQKSTEDYFLAGRSLSWFSVGSASWPRFSPPSPTSPPRER